MDFSEFVMIDNKRFVVTRELRNIFRNAGEIMRGIIPLLIFLSPPNFPSRETRGGAQD